MTRQEHLQWCKDRAMEYVEKGDYQNAVASMLSDLGKHDDTKKSAETCGMLGIMTLMNPSRDSVAKFIQGFN